MGNLMKDTPYSEITATLEALACHGVSREHLGLIRKDEGHAKAIANVMIKGFEFTIGNPNSSGFSTWKTIQLGTHRSPKALGKAIFAKNNQIEYWGYDILKRISVSPKEETIDLVKVTVYELGFTDGAIREQIYEAAFKLGLMGLPAEVGPQLRLQYQNQPSGESIEIGMESIVDSRGCQRLFSVGSSGNEYWLGVDYSGARSFYNHESVWVFGRRPAA